MYVTLKSNAAPGIPASSPCLSGCGLGDASTGAIDQIARSMGTTTPTFLMLIGGGIVTGWLLNDLITSTKRRARATDGRIKSVAKRKVRQTFDQHKTASTVLAFGFGFAAIGLAYYLYSRRRTGLPEAKSAQNGVRN